MVKFLKRLGNQPVMVKAIEKIEKKKKKLKFGVQKTKLEDVGSIFDDR